MPERILAPFKYIGKQFGQMYRGVRSLVSREFVRDLVPDWILKLTVEAVPNALWGETPRDQIHGSIILMGWGIATSAFTGGATVVFVWFWSLFFWIGVIRYSDLGSGAWDKLTSVTRPELPGRGSDGSYGRRRRGG